MIINSATTGGSAVKRRIGREHNPSLSCISREGPLRTGGMIKTILRVKTLPHRATAFLLMAKQTVIAETHATERAVELLTVKDFVSAFTAFDRSIDQLKHQTFVSSSRD